ncbi:MAG: ATP-binding cassette domain-containing protein [Phyllobacteriaceae bacterium]|nr:ATP-binding cassette domain-containing protein [Phyllobacteriaceae bacterium]
MGLRLDKVTIALGDHDLLEVDCAIAPGEVLTIMGPSGSGKSTLLSFVAGSIDPAFRASGRIVCAGRDLTGLPPQERHAGILFQDALLFPHMSVGGNILFAIPAAERGRARRRSLAEAALADVGLAGFYSRDPATLSGGQKARVALARVLASHPSMLLLDEPFSRLDADLRGRTRDLVFAAVRARRLPALLVTHDEADAAAAGGPVIRISA